MPVSEMDFPAITICAQGLDMTAVQNAMKKDFQIWMKSQKNLSTTISTNMDTYLNEKYGHLFQAPSYIFIMISNFTFYGLIFKVFI